MTAQGESLTHLLEEWSKGNSEALNLLALAVYPELRRLAASELLNERRQHPRSKPHTLAPTELVNAAFLKLLEQERINWEGRRHFFAVAAMMMRRVLTDHARARVAGNLGQGFTLFSLDDNDARMEIATERAAELIALDDALVSLGKRDPRKVQIVEMRFYGGWTYDEIGQYLGVHPESVRNQWRFAKLWLLREITGAEPQTFHHNSTTHDGAYPDATTHLQPDAMAED